MDKKPAYNGRGMRVTACCHVNIGAVGAPTVDATKCDDPGMTISRVSAGLYNLVYPKSVDARIDVELVSATPTVFGHVLTAKSATAGTAVLRINNAAGAATDPANGDAINLTYLLDAENV